jgi:hypothetical protein
MRNRICTALLVLLLLLLCAAVCVHEKAPSPSPQQTSVSAQPAIPAGDQAAAATANRAQRRHSSRSFNRFNRLVAWYDGDLSPEKIHERIQELQHQLEQLGSAPAFGAANCG